MIPDYSYAELLSRLRRDLQLDASTDLLHGTLDMALADLVSPGHALGQMMGSQYFKAGTGTFTWAAATPVSGNVVVALSGAVGHVFSVHGAGPISAGDFAVIKAIDNNNGTVTFSAVTRLNGNPGAGATCPFYYLIWGS